MEQIASTLSQVGATAMELAQQVAAQVSATPVAKAVYAGHLALEDFMSTEHNLIPHMEFERKLSTAAGLSIDQLRVTLALFASVMLMAGIRLFHNATGANAINARKTTRCELELDQCMRSAAEPLRRKTSLLATNPYTYVRCSSSPLRAGDGGAHRLLPVRQRNHPRASHGHLRLFGAPSCSPPGGNDRLVHRLPLPYLPVRAGSRGRGAVVLPLCAGNARVGDLLGVGAPSESLRWTPCQQPADSSWPR